MHATPSLLDGRHDAVDSGLTALSVCSSVGGMDLGLHRAGVQAVGFCEIDPWRRAVLRRHWGPFPPIWEDLVALADECEADPGAVLERLGGRPDLLAGGTPCQDLSSAGKRAGLGGSRSELFWAYMRVRNALGIEWALWENVAGTYTSNGGMDFMAVLGAFVGADVTFPARGWTTDDAGERILDHDVPRSGVAAGPWGGCCWRLLNAQHFGVPQRRRRVFVVGRLGGPCPPEVLLERRGDGGHTEAGRAPGAHLARQAARAARGGRGGGLARGGRGRVGAGGRGDGRAVERDVPGSLTARFGATNVDFADAEAGWVVPDAEPYPALTAREGKGPDFGATSAPPVAATLTGGGHPNSAAPGRRSEDDRNIVAAAGESERLAGEPGRDAGRGGADRVSLRPEDRTPGQAARRRPGADDDEGRDAGRDDGERAAAADADGVRAPDGLAGRVDVPAAVQEGEGTIGLSLHADYATGSDVMPPVTGSHGQPGVVAPEPLVPMEGGATHALTAEGADASEDGTGRGPPIVAAPLTSETAPGQPGHSGGDQHVVEGEPYAPDAAGSLKGHRGVGGGGFDVEEAAGGQVVEAPRAYRKKRAGQAPGDGDGDTYAETDVARAVCAANAHRQDDSPAMVEAREPAVLDAYNQSAVEDGSVPALRGSAGSPQSQDVAVANTVRSHPRPGSNSFDLVADPATGETCPEGDACAWDPAPDGRRYAGCGDGVAGPVAHWIGLRLVAAASGEDPDA